MQARLHKAKLLAEQLPIHEVLEDLVYSIVTNGSVVLEAPPGAGEQLS